MSLGQKIAKIAQTQINKFGSMVTLQHATGAPVFNAVAGKAMPPMTSQTLKATFRRVRADQVNGTTVQANDTLLTVAALDASFVPVPNDTVLIGGVTWNVGPVTTNKAQDVAVSHEIIIRK